MLSVKSCLESIYLVMCMGILSKLHFEKQEIFSNFPTQDLLTNFSNASQNLGTFFAKGTSLTQSIESDVHNSVNSSCSFELRKHY